jgi:hypothetical protein
VDLSVLPTVRDPDAPGKENNGQQWFCSPRRVTERKSIRTPKKVHLEKGEGTGWDAWREVRSSRGCGTPEEILRKRGTCRGSRSRTGAKAREIGLWSSTRSYDPHTLE